MAEALKVEAAIEVLIGEKVPEPVPDEVRGEGYAVSTHVEGREVMGIGETRQKALWDLLLNIALHKRTAVVDD